MNIKLSEFNNKLWLDKIPKGFFLFFINNWIYHFQFIKIVVGAIALLCTIQHFTLKPNRWQKMHLLHWWVEMHLKLLNDFEALKQSQYTAISYVRKPYQARLRKY